MVEFVTLRVPELRRIDVSGPASFDGGMVATGTQTQLLGPFLGSGADLRFELETDPSAADGDDPFVCLDDLGSFSRVLLARAAIGGTTVRRVALKIQRDHYPSAPAGLSNQDVDEAWKRESADLIAAQGPGVAALVAPELLSQSLPVIHCRRQRVYFHPPCGTTGEPLTVCHDDTLLRSYGLKAYSTSLVRYLHAKAAAPGGEPTFYKSERTPEEAISGIRLRSGSELFRDWRSLVHQGAAAKTRSPFPCTTCEHRERCYPKAATDGEAIPAESVLVPVSYYDFHCLPLEPLDLRYDELCQLLGGADWNSVAANVCGPGTQGKRLLVDRLGEHYRETRRQWTFRQDPGGRFLWEVLRLKLIAFGNACEGVLRVHRECQRPQLDVSPSNLMASIPESGASIPARWNFDVRLLDLGSVRTLKPNHPSNADMPLVLAPGLGADRMHVSPMVGKRESESARATLTIRERQETPSGFRLTIEAQCGSAFDAPYLPGDVVRVMRQADWLWCRLTAVRGRVLDLAGVAQHAQPASAWVAGRPFDAGLLLYRMLGPACDLFGLGMLLFRTLLVHDQRDAAAVEKIVAHCLKKLEVTLDHNPREARSVLLRFLRNDPATFDFRGVLHPEAERRRVVAPGNQELWRDILILGFQLVTQIQGFSFAWTHSDERPKETVMSHVLAALCVLQQRVEAELFASEQRAAEIRELCAVWRAEVERHVRGDEAQRPEPSAQL